MHEGIEDWFVQEILCHEPALTRYVSRAWAIPADVHDLRQEIYVKVLESAERSRPPHARYFLFTVARNLLADHARRRRIVPIALLQGTDVSNVLVDEVSPERSAGGLQQLQKLVAAFEQLPDRCREAVWMRKIDGLTQKEIAERLGIAEGTVEAHLVRGMRLLTQLFYADNADPGRMTRSPNVESQHGK